MFFLFVCDKLSFVNHNYLEIEYAKHRLDRVTHYLASVFHRLRGEFEARVVFDVDHNHVISYVVLPLNN